MKEKKNKMIKTLDEILQDALVNAPSIRGYDTEEKAYLIWDSRKQEWKQGRRRRIRKYEEKESKEKND